MRYLPTLACLLLATATLAEEADVDFSSLGAKKTLRDYKKAANIGGNSVSQKITTFIYVASCNLKKVFLPTREYKIH